MASMEGQSPFMKALNASSGFIVSSAFPQVDTFLKYIEEKFTEKDKEKKEETADKEESRNRSRSSSRGGLSSSAIDVIDQGFDELHNDLDKTNIILTLSLEAQNNTNKLLEKLILSGGGGRGGFGGGGGNIINDVEKIGMWELGKKLIGGLFTDGLIAALGSVATVGAIGGAAGGGGAMLLANSRENKLEEERARDLGISVEELRKKEPDLITKSGMTPDEYKENHAKIDALMPIINNQNNLIEALREQIEELKKLHRDYTFQQEKMEDLEKKRDENVRTIETLKSQTGESGGSDTLKNRSPDVADLDREMNKVAVAAGSHNPPMPTFGNQGIEAAQSRNQNAIEQLQSRIHGHSTATGGDVNYGDESKSTGVAKGSITSSLFRGESGGSYDIFNYNGGRNVGHGDLQNMTIGQIMEAQRQGKIFAAGAYQMIPKTLQAGVEHLHLDPSQKFDKATQDKLYTEWLAGAKRPQIRDYIMGKNDNLEAAHLATAQEWASVAYHGKSYYPNDRASISDEQIESALRKGREIFAKTGNYKAALDGMIPNNSNDSHDQNRTALLAAGTNDWESKEKSYKGVKDSLQALKDKGYDPVLILPNKNVRGKSDAYDGALQAASEMGIKTEYPSGFSAGADSIHMSPQAAKEIRAKYPGAYITGDSNSVRLGAKEGQSGFTGKGGEFIADKIRATRALTETTVPGFSRTVNPFLPPDIQSNGEDITKQILAETQPRIELPPDAQSSGADVTRQILGDLPPDIKTSGDDVTKQILAESKSQQKNNQPPIPANWFALQAGDTSYANLRRGGYEIDNRNQNPMLDFSAIDPPNFGPAISNANVDNEVKKMQTTKPASAEVKHSYDSDKSSKDDSSDKKKSSDKNDAGTVAPPDERLRKLFDNYNVA